MSVEASITLFKCDNCSALICCKSDEDWQNFERDWYSGLSYQFCPDCKDKIETQGRQAEDETIPLNFVNEKDLEEANAAA